MIDSAMLVRIAAQIDEPMPSIKLARAIWKEAFNAGLEAAQKVVKASYRGVYDGETCAAAVRAQEMK